MALTATPLTTPQQRIAHDLQQAEERGRQEGLEEGLRRSFQSFSEAHTAPLKAAHISHQADTRQHASALVRHASAGGFWRGLACGAILMALISIGCTWAAWKDFTLTQAAAHSIETRGAVVEPLHITDGDGAPVHEGGLTRNPLTGRPLHAPADARP